MLRGRPKAKFFCGRSCSGKYASTRNNLNSLDEISDSMSHMACESKRGHEFNWYSDKELKSSIRRFRDAFLDGLDINELIERFGNKTQYLMGHMSDMDRFRRNGLAS